MKLRPGDGVRVTDADESPWRDAKVVGRGLNRAEGLAHSLVQEAFHIVGHAVLDNEPLRAYLVRAATFSPNQGRKERFRMHMKLRRYHLGLRSFLAATVRSCGPDVRSAPLV